MFNRSFYQLLTLFLLLCFNIGVSQNTNTNIKAVAIIAHSVSTSIKARELITKMNWVEVPPKKADHVLVVCRSELFDPLKYSYNCYCELNDDAENQLNISGSNYHVYVYFINDDLSVNQLYHDSFLADQY